MSDLVDLKERVDATINMADERHYFGASVKYQRALEARVAKLEAEVERLHGVVGEYLTALEEANAEVERLTVRDDAGNPVDANALARNLLALLDEARSEVERLRADRKILFALRNAAEHVWDITIDDPDNTDAVLELLAKPLDDAKKVFDRVIAETDARAALAGEEGGE